MNFAPEDTDLLMMSDSLKGNVPELEEQIRLVEDSIIIVGIEYYVGDEKEVLAGSVTGLSFEEKIIKIDFKRSTSDAYKFLKLNLIQGEVTCKNLYFQNNEDDFVISGPFRITSPRLTDLDHKEKTCTIGLDFVRIAP